MPESVPELNPAGEPYDGPMFNLGDEVQRKVVEWRMRQLERAGMTLLDARLLAVRRDVDVARCRAMLERGCTPQLLKEISL